MICTFPYSKYIVIRRPRNHKKNRNLYLLKPIICIYCLLCTTFTCVQRVTFLKLCSRVPFSCKCISYVCGLYKKRIAGLLRVVIYYTISYYNTSSTYLVCSIVCTVHGGVYGSVKLHRLPGVYNFY